MNESDEEVATRVQRGDSEAFGELVERYQEKLTRYARKFMSDTDEGKDVIQDVFLKAYENIQSFDPSRRFSPWIYRIAHNEFINSIEKRKRLPFFHFDFDTLFPHLTAAESADDRALDRSLRETLEKYLDKLDMKYREPLVLYYFEGMSYQTIAEVLRIPINTVGVRIARGKTMLQKIADPEDLYA